MTNNSMSTGKYLAYNQGVATSNPIINFNRPTPTPIVSQPVIGQQFNQIQTNFVIKWITLNHLYMKPANAGFFFAI